MSYSKQLVAWKKRRAKVAKLRREGMSYQDIADILKVSKQRVLQLYRQHLKDEAKDD